MDEVCFKCGKEFIDATTGMSCASCGNRIHRLCSTKVDEMNCGNHEESSIDGHDEDDDDGDNDERELS